MINNIPPKLQQLYNQFDACSRCKKEKNPLRHILGGGKFNKPTFFFLFINPTHLNLSCHKKYRGKRRYPFIGVRYFYRLMAEAGFCDQNIVDKIYKNGWKINDENRVESSLIKHSIYISNIVKCTQNHPGYPSPKVIQQDLILLKQEINIIKPKYIVAFGKLPIKILTGQDIKLADYLIKIKNNKYRSLPSIAICNKYYPVLPCYFPIGRGNPQKALTMLRYIKRKFN